MWTEVGKWHRNILHFSKTQNTQVKGQDATGDGKCVTATTVTLFACLTNHRAVKT
jgi:hypothetical protein